jgi:glutamine synthetase
MTPSAPARAPKAFGLRDEKDVLAVLRDPASEVQFVRLFFPDILGRQMDFTIPASEVPAAFKDGKGFDGSSVAGFVRIEESDLVIKPDPKTFRVLPWTYQGFGEGVRWREAVMFGDILKPDGSVYGGDSRAALKRVLARARKEIGIDDFKCGPELEFFIFPSSDAPVLTDVGGYFFSGRHGEIRKEIQLLLQRMGIATEYDHHEVAHSQHEIDLRYDDAVEMADTAMIFRYMTKKVCRMHGLYATFMPKPVNGQNGSGMHVHQSLWRGGRNLFFDKNGPYHLSLLAQRYMAGVMAHAREISAVLSQWATRPPSTSPGARGTGPPTSASPSTSRARRWRPGSSSGPPIPPATSTSPSPSCWPPAPRGSGRSSSWPTRSRRTSIT